MRLLYALVVLGILCFALTPATVPVVTPRRRALPLGRLLRLAEPSPN